MLQLTGAYPIYRAVRVRVIATKLAQASTASNCRAEELQNYRENSPSRNREREKMRGPSPSRTGRERNLARGVSNNDRSIDQSTDRSIEREREREREQSAFVVVYSEAHP